MGIDLVCREAVAVVTVLSGFFAEQKECAAAEHADATRSCAEGIILGLRRCSIESASRELTEVSNRYRLDTNRVAQALVRLAQEVNPESDSAATSVARYEWGALLPRSGDTPQGYPPLAEVLG
jgi:hypothetical protein